MNVNRFFQSLAKSEKIAFGSLFVFLVVLPMVQYNQLIDLVTLPRAFFLGLVVVIINVTYLLSQENSRSSYLLPLVKTPIGIGFMVLFLLSAISVFWATNMAEAIWATTRIGLWFLFWLVTAQFVQNHKEGIRWIARAITIMGILIVVLGFFDLLKIADRLAENKILYEVNATLEHKNLLASALFLCLPFMVIAGWKDRIWRWIALFGGVGALSLIFFTQTRAVWLALGLLLLLGIGLIIFRKQRMGRIPFSTLIVFAFILGTFSFGWWINRKNTSNANSAVDRIAAIFEYQDVKNEHTETIRERLQLWDNSMEMIQEYPVTGVGGGNWKVFFPKYGMDGLRSDQGTIHFVRPHNDYLWFFSELGILGLLAFLALFMGSWWMLYQYKKNEGADFIHWAAMFGIKGYAIIAFFDFPSERIIHTVLLALLFAFLCKDLSSARSKTSGQKGIWLLTLFFSIGFLIIVSIRFTSELKGRQLLEARMVDNYRKVINAANDINTTLYSVSPTGTPIEWYKGEAYFYQHKKEQALSALQEAYKIHPYHLHVLNNLGACYAMLEQKDSAILYFEKALSIAPAFVDANLNRAAISVQEKKYQKAFEQVAQAKPDSNNLRYRQFLEELSGWYIQKIIKKVEEKPLNLKFQEMQTNVDWLINVHIRARENDIPLSRQIVDEAVYTLEVSHEITEEEGERLRKKYYEQ